MTLLTGPAIHPAAAHFENVAAHLTDDGLFVHEAGVPRGIVSSYIEPDLVDVDGFRHHVLVVLQAIEPLSRDRVRVSPIVTRYAWPSELDLMARVAGLRLKERWDGWNREPFTATGNCISVYGR